MRWLFVVAILLMPNAALACYAWPEHQYVPVDELIDRTSTIVLAKAIKAELYKPEFDKDLDGLIQLDTGEDVEPYEVRFSFDVIEEIKGDVPRNFLINGYRLEEKKRYYNHSEEEFWKDTSGRMPTAPDCNIQPAFAVGHSYLMFLERPFHKKSFEEIATFNDGRLQKSKWLEYVRSKVREND